MYSILNTNNDDQLDVIALRPSKVTEMHSQKYCPIHCIVYQPVIIHSIVLSINCSCILRFNFQVRYFENSS